MDDDVNQQRLQDYRQRMTSWIGRQGLFFQIRYLRLAGGGSLLTRFVSFFTTLLVWLVVLSLVSFGALRFYKKSDAYRARLRDRIGQALGAESIETKGFFKVAGNGGFRTVKLEGGEESFFYEAKFSDLEGPFPFFANVVKDWSPETVLLRKAEVSLRAGGSVEEMEAAMSGILASLEEEGPSRIRIDNFNCEWGYSKLTFGGIYESKFEASLVDGKWEIDLEGGFFRQNWLGPMVIEEGLLTVSQEGLRVDSLRLSEAGGSLELAGWVRGPANIPDVSLKGTFHGIPVESLFKVAEVEEDRFLEGPISGELEISGSTNRNIRMDGKVVLGENDELRIRDEWKLLRALAAVARDGTYHRIAFGSGSFEFTTQKGILEVNDIQLASEGVAKLEGSFSTRLLTQKEAAEILGIALTKDFSNALTDTSSAQRLEEERISLRKAARIAGDAEDGFEISLDRDEELEEVRRVQASIKELDGMRLSREMARPRYDGNLRMGLPISIFESTPTLPALYPQGEPGWMWIPITLDSHTFVEISEEGGEKLLAEGQARRSSSSGSR